MAQNGENLKNTVWIWAWKTKGGQITHGLEAQAKPVLQGKDRASVTLSRQQTLEEGNGTRGDHLETSKPVTDAGLAKEG